MGLLTAAKALLTSDGVIEKGSKAIDALHLSKEEEAELNIKLIDAKAKLLESSSASALTRRILAVIVSVYWLCCNVIYTAMWLFCYATEVDSTNLFEFEGYLDEQVTPAFMLVIGFYFGVRMFEKIRK